MDTTVIGGLGGRFAVKKREKAVSAGAEGNSKYREENLGVGGAPSRR